MFGLFKSRKEEEPEIEPGEAANQQLRAVLPRHERVNSYKEIRITTSTGYQVRGIVIDHSESGIRVRFQSYETLTDVVALHCPELRIRGTGRVVWTDQCDLGIELLSNEYHSR